MQMGQEKYGMQTMNQALFVQFHNRKISRETALSRSSEPDELLQMMANPASVIKRMKPGTVKVA
jgi:twitching motility protein PilT